MEYMDSQKMWELWNTQDLADADLKTELQSIEFDEEKKAECFYKELEFGTGGLRGIIGVGNNRMNIYTVAKATQGYSDYLNQHFTVPSVAIAYDSRNKSDKFSQVAAEVFAANGIKVFIFSELMPTPALSFAIRYLNCSGGIVITASHNPAEYNGYKVYDADGCQITTEAADEILNQITRIDIFTGVKQMPFEMGVQNGTISYIDEQITTAYIDSVSAQSLSGADSIDKNISIVYTPLNGAGLKSVTRCLKENGFTNISIVAEQEFPDGNFSTCPYPNPEKREALELGLRDARQLGGELLLATDPDCDRVGIAVKAEGDYILLNGNEVGLLLFDYICMRRITLEKMPQNPVMVKTIVTTDLAKKIAEDYKVDAIDVLTGFKFIGEQIGILEKGGEEFRYIFGFEESYGYLTGSYVRDKDAVNGALMICEMTAYYKSKGKSLVDVLNSLYAKFGYCLNTLHCYEYRESAGLNRMKKIMERFRSQKPECWAGRKILSVSDYNTSMVEYADGKEQKLNLPKSNVLKYQLEGNLSLVVRPSGTEPKLKMYFSINAKDKAAAQDLEKKIVTEIENTVLHIKG